MAAAILTIPAPLSRLPLSRSRDQRLAGPGHSESQEPGILRARGVTDLGFRVYLNYQNLLFCRFLLQTLTWDFSAKEVGSGGLR